MKLLRTEFQRRKVTSCVTSTVRHNGVTHSLLLPPLPRVTIPHSTHWTATCIISPCTSLSPAGSCILLSHRLTQPSSTPTTPPSPHLYSPLNTMMSSLPCHLTTVAHLTLTTHPITTRQLHTKHPPPTPVATPPITVVDSCFRTSTVPSRPSRSFIMSLN